MHGNYTGLARAQNKDNNAVRKGISEDCKFEVGCALLKDKYIVVQNMYLHNINSGTVQPYFLYTVLLAVLITLIYNTLNFFNLEGIKLSIKNLSNKSKQITHEMKSQVHILSSLPHC